MSDEVIDLNSLLALVVHANMAMSHIMDVDDRVDALKPLLANKSIPLESRWETYEGLVKSGALRTIEFYGEGFIDDISSFSSLHDSFGYERYQTISYIDMYETLLGVLEDASNLDLPDYSKEYLTEYWEGITVEKVDTWREAVLASGYAGFIYDW